MKMYSRKEIEEMFISGNVPEEFKIDPGSAILSIYQGWVARKGISRDVLLTLAKNRDSTKQVNSLAHKLSGRQKVSTKECAELIEIMLESWNGTAKQLFSISGYEPEMSNQMSKVIFSTALDASNKIINKSLFLHKEEDVSLDLLSDLVRDKNILLSSRIFIGLDIDVSVKILTSICENLSKNTYMCLIFDLSMFSQQKYSLDVLNIKVNMYRLLMIIRLLEIENKIKYLIYKGSPDFVPDKLLSQNKMVVSQRFLANRMSINFGYITFVEEDQCRYYIPVDIKQREYVKKKRGIVAPSTFLKGDGYLLEVKEADASVSSAQVSIVRALEGDIEMLSKLSLYDICFLNHDELIKTYMI